MWFCRTSNRLFATKLWSVTARRLLSDEVRVRFAPSPTGFIHLGGLRTAFYNFLFAKQNNGSFVLRIEDTDRERVVSGSLENLEEMLVWTGLTPDEGPTKGGQYGPYIQSQRTDLYKQHLEHLLSSGLAYHCFCSEMRLKLLRKEQLKNRETPKYDNRCRHLTQSEVEEKLSAGQAFTVRLKLKEGPIVFDDLVLGKTTLDLAAVESDPVIFKSDGFPTYHFANVIDDHYMKISHVLRGAEWHGSTPKHLMLYEAFGWSPPAFAHLPLILNKDGTKLSKRQNDIRIDYYRDNGFYPKSVINYLSTIGGGFDDIRDDNSNQSLEQLIKSFDIKKVKDNDNKIDVQKLNSLNRSTIHWYFSQGMETKLIEDFKCLLISTFGSSEDINLGDNYVKSLLRIAFGIDSYSDKFCTEFEEKVFTLKDLLKDDFIYLWKTPDFRWNSESIGSRDEIESVLNSAIDLLNNYDNSGQEFNHKHILDAIKNRFNEQFDQKFSPKIKFSKYMKILRLSLTNLENGPPIAQTIEILGPKTSINYLRNALTFVKSRDNCFKSQINS